MNQAFLCIPLWRKIADGKRGGKKRREKKCLSLFGSQQKMKEKMGGPGYSLPYHTKINLHQIGSWYLVLHTPSAFLTNM